MLSAKLLNCLAQLNLHPIPNQLVLFCFMLGYVHVDLIGMKTK